MIVKIERYYRYPNIQQQTPNQSMRWKEMVFTEDDVLECDYLVVLDYPKKDFSIRVNKSNIINLCLEPPNEMSKYRQFANSNVALNFNQFDTKTNNILSHGALPWHLNKDYDFLSSLQSNFVEKDNKIAWITSNQRGTKGHMRRMDFLDNIKELDFVDCFGRGIKEVDDKFEILKNYKYAIAYENFKNDFYWTEKIIDSFLSYTMPLYFGCESIDDFFPKGSFIQIDPNDKHIKLFLQEIVSSKKWEQNLDSLTKARDLVLNQYQLFPFLYNQIKSLESIKGAYKKDNKELIFIKGGNEYFDNYPISLDLLKLLSKVKAKATKVINVVTNTKK